ncbi:MAG: hypothetical protein AAFY38_06945 [Pseudomonadota bacterium]
MRYLFVFLLLAACNTPSPGFRGVDPTRITIDGSTFDVRVKELRAEAMRVNMQYAPRFGPIEARAAAAMAQVSGCAVKTVSGDQALAFGTLDCGNGPPPMTYGRNVALDCYEIDSFGSGTGYEYLTFDCDVSAY